MNNSKKRTTPAEIDAEMARAIRRCRTMTVRQLDAELATLRIDPQPAIDSVKEIVAAAVAKLHGHRRSLHEASASMMHAMARSSKGSVTCGQNSFPEDPGMRSSMARNRAVLPTGCTLGWPPRRTGMRGHSPSIKNFSTRRQIGTSGSAIPIERRRMSTPSQYSNERDGHPG